MSQTKMEPSSMHDVASRQPEGEKVMFTTSFWKRWTIVAQPNDVRTQFGQMRAARSEEPVWPIRLRFGLSQNDVTQPLPRFGVPMVNVFSIV